MERRPDKNVYGPNFQQLRKQLLNDGIRCRFCGIAEATEAHHWEYESYPSDDELALTDLTPVCSICHKMITSLRRFIRMGGSLLRFKVALDALWETVVTFPEDVGRQVPERTMEAVLPSVRVERAVRDDDRVEVVVRLPSRMTPVLTRADDQETPAPSLPRVTKTVAVRGDDPE